MTVDINGLVAKYVELRDGIERIDKKAKEDKAPLAKAMEAIESGLMKLMQDQGVKQLKTEAGTAFITQASHCGVENFDAVLADMKARDDFSLLNKAVSKNAVKEYIDKFERPPPGVKWTVMNEVQVRRS